MNEEEIEINKIRDEEVLEEFKKELNKDLKYHNRMLLSFLFGSIFGILTLIFLFAFGLFTLHIWIVGVLFVINRAIREFI